MAYPEHRHTVADAGAQLEHLREQGYDIPDNPACMNITDWESYILTAIRVKKCTNKNKRPMNYCRDCDAVYAAKMKAVGKCNQ